MSGVIVVGVDSSETAKNAAETARSLAIALGASLHVVTAYENDRTEVLGEGSDQVVISQADSAERVAGMLVKSSESDLTVTHFAARGKPADALVQEATRLNATLIVVGNRRMRGIGRVLGSVANSVAHNAPCDVYIANTY
ncbi:universal stress protein [Arthrobacter sp. D2-10]